MAHQQDCLSSEGERDEVQHSQNDGEQNQTKDDANAPKQTRSSTEMHRIMKLRQKGEKITVEFDKDNHSALGSEGSELMSFIGMMIR